MVAVKVSSVGLQSVPLLFPAPMVFVQVLIGEMVQTGGGGGGKIPSTVY